MRLSRPLTMTAMALSLVRVVAAVVAAVVTAVVAETGTTLTRKSVTTMC
jgi:hypothetical protein